MVGQGFAASLQLQVRFITLRCAIARKLDVVWYAVMLHAPNKQNVLMLVRYFDSSTFATNPSLHMFAECTRDLAAYGDLHQ